MGVETFMDRILIPYFNAKFPLAARSSYIFVLDPACYQRSQANELTIAQVVAQRGFTAVRAVTNDPEKRQMALEGLLNRQVDGGPGLLIDPGCTHLADGLEWGFRYKKAPEGQVSTTRDKTHHSHTVEAGEYMAGYFNVQDPTSATPWRSVAKQIKQVSHFYV